MGRITCCIPGIAEGNTGGKKEAEHSGTARAHFSALYRAGLHNTRSLNPAAKCYISWLRAPVRRSRCRNVYGTCLHAQSLREHPSLVIFHGLLGTAFPLGPIFAPRGNCKVRWTQHFGHGCYTGDPTAIHLLCRLTTIRPLCMRACTCPSYARSTEYGQHASWLRGYNASQDLAANDNCSSKSEAERSSHRAVRTGNAQF
mmetsp:Transcript_91045/g.162052  ORF Transcript_91045/g.162052 Transcript_91045/m.162052 type:complete len:200 (+) Transcript_91045:1619-2218(+)